MLNALYASFLSLSLGWKVAAIVLLLAAFPVLFVMAEIVIGIEIILLLLGIFGAGFGLYHFGYITF